jgi:class 3 adenylate cyclase/tetratricopeptide (TPR) repeat protein
VPEVQVVTVAFTDLVGSTELSSRLDPVVADQLRDTHFALLREAVQAHGGTEVKNLGDGLMVVFSTTSGALNCAEAMQQGIARYNQKAPEPLSVRVGLSHGEVAEDGGDYFGDPVVEAARLCSTAEGGQILASQVVQLTAGRRAQQEFASIGDLTLKGFPEPVATVEVRWAAESFEGEGVMPLPRRSTTIPAAGFVGRTGERAVLSDALKNVVSEGRHRLVLIGGEPGMGKTSLATDFARAAHRDDAIVLFGRADEELAAPYGPWAEALTHLANCAPDSLLASLTPHAGSLVRIVPALATRLGRSDDPPTADPEAARYLLFGAVTAALAVASQLAPVVLILDDLQWADAPSLQLLRHVVETTETLRMLVIGTFRESHLPAGHPLADLLGALHRESGTERISLRGLDDLELLAMMEGAAGHEMDEDGLVLRDALVAETDGNPFFAGELLRHLVETGAIYQEGGRWVGSVDLRGGGLPVSVREVIGRRVARLGEATTRVLAIASVIGRDFDLSLLVAVSELDEDALLDVMDQATEAILIDNVRANRYTFVHALIEHTLYESLSPTRRARLHRAVAEAIEAQARGRSDLRAAELAYHWAQATAPEDLDKAVHYAQAAGDEALTRLAPDEALRWYSQALARLEQRLNGPDERRCQLLVGLGNAQRQSGNPTYRQTLLDAAHLAQDLGDTQLLVEAALANNRGIFSVLGVVDAERVTVLEAACNALEGTDSAEQARLLGLLASELTFGGDFDRRKALAARALDIARQSGDLATLVRVVNDTLISINVPEGLSESLALSAEASAASQGLGDPILQFWSSAQGCVHRYQAGEVAEGDEALSRVQAIADRLGQPVLRMQAAGLAAARATLAGDFDDAEQLALQAAEFGNASAEPDIAAAFFAQLGVIRFMQGRSDEIVDLAVQVAAENLGVPTFSIFIAMMHCDLNHPDEARAVLDPFVADDFASVPKDMIWLTAMHSASYVVSELGWVEPAEALMDRLRPFAGQIVCVGAVTWGGVSYALGLLAATLDRYDDADAYFSQSAATHERIGAAWGLAMTQLAWGRYLAARNEPEHLERGRSLLEQALTTARIRDYKLAERRALEALESVRGR